MNYFNLKIAPCRLIEGVDMSHIDRIALNSVKGLGPVRIKHLIDYYGSAEEVFRRSGDELVREGIIPATCIAGLLGKELRLRRRARQLAPKKRAWKYSRLPRRGILRISRRFLPRRRFFSFAAMFRCLPFPA